MKLNGMAGKGSGKLGSMVYAVIDGTQVVREYNDRVRNPNTAKQVLQRARFSVLTKVAAQLSDSLLFQGRKSMVTNRNAFIKANSEKFEEESSSLYFNSLALTSGNVEAAAYPIVSVNSSTHMMTISMSTADANFAGFGYAVILVTDAVDGTSWTRAGIVTAIPEMATTVSITLPTGEGYGEAYVIGYPMYYKDAATRASYAQQLTAEDLTDNVSLNVEYNRMASLGDLRVYATKPLAKTV